MQARVLLLALSLGLAAAQPAPSLAQAVDGAALSAEEIEGRFQSQKLTRGLVIAPAGAAGAEAQGVATTVDPADDLVEVPLPDQVSVSIVFDFDSAALRDDQKPKLAALCQAMNNVDVNVFRIVGHTDAAGPDDYNLQLSTLRAEEVKRHLVGDCGIAAERLEAVGAGKRQLLDAANPTSERNRRVEFQVMS